MIHHEKIYHVDHYTTIDRDRTMFQMFVGNKNDTKEIYVGSIDREFDPAAVLEYFSAIHPEN